MGLSSKQIMIKTIDGVSSSNNNIALTGMKRQHHQISQSQAAGQSEPLNCPRCDSINTKFCYYNNYNKSQPRHFCRACKRHWTKGGTLRNVPVGGGRKNKRPKKSSETHSRHVSLNPDHHRDDHDDKSVSEILFQAMMVRPNPTPPPISSSSHRNLPAGISENTAAGIFAAAPSPASLVTFPFNQTLNFSAVSSPFDSGSCLSSISNSIQNNVNGGCDTSELDQAAAYKINGVVSQQPWQPLVSSNGNNGFDYNSYNWNFEDIDTLVSADHINLAWEDSLDIIKP